MKILNLDKKNNYVKLKIENPEDIWYLSQIVFPGDQVRGKSTRKIDKTEKDERSKGTKKKTFTLGLEVEKVEFLADSNAIKVIGTVLDDIEDIPKGSHQNIRIEQESIVSIMKEKFLDYQWKYIQESEKSKGKNVLLCAVDRESALFALLKGHGYEVLSQLEGEVEKKDSRNVKVGDFYADLDKTLRDYDNKYEFERIVMGCPGFWKKELSEKLNPIIVKKIVFINAGSGTESGLNEMLRATELKKVLKEERVNSEVEAVEELLSEIGKEGNVVYGYEDVNAAVEAGAVQKLLVTNRLIKTLVEENKFKELNELMKKVEDASGELKIINSSHEGGAKLDGLGSIGAILRYKIR